ncbi:PAN2-PAN3 deadenylation complex subunit pan3-like [Crassostrea angulata]|uniref:PAN2-PAN3 deadenylation complex subunit PAN3 n=1 Tax=Magallana gigas TaxID=29159 RepID=A0A8W8MSC5_MAGGI|nr:PAN2-PAN3 deadenylation complex subunit pan3 [Crassostrea gigas]XP_052672759.1 PAN2-PAN3 deadenylation complex subunit pan3-like [Crassostrea angulata]
MTSSNPAGRKPALCRFFVNTGNCVYGDECQFLHQNPGMGFQKPFSNGPLHSSENHGLPDSLGNNGDQYFNATFGGESTVPEFNPFSRPPMGRPGRGMIGPSGPGPNFGPNNPRMDLAAGEGRLDCPPGGPMRMDNFRSDNPRMDHGLASDFAALNLQIPNTTKGPNPIANEFIPKSSSLSHSASSPNFSTINGNGYIPPHSNGPPPPPPMMISGQPENHSVVAGAPPNSMMMSNTPPPHLVPTSGVSLATTSPSHSPHLSPSNSPLMMRRTASPIAPLKQTTTPKKSNNTTIQENVGGTTYFYSPDDFNPQHEATQLPNFSMFPSLPPHIAHLTVKKNMPQFFMPDELKMDILNRHALTMAQLDTTQTTDIPAEVDNYHNLFPLEPPLANPMQKSNTFGYPTTCYKAVNTKDGLTYCLRRVHGFRLSNTKCMSIIDMWKKMYHPNIVQLREVFTTKAFGDNSIVFVYDFFPGAETVLLKHFSGPGGMNGYTNAFNMEGGSSSRSYNSSNKGLNGPRQHAGLLPESMIWAYVVQLSSALRAIHAAGLAFRTMDPSKILIYSKSRIRLNCVGILDVLTFDSQGNPPSAIQHYQQEDLVYLGKVVLALACNTVMAIKRDNFQNSMELIARNYSADLKNFFLYLLTNQTRPRSINDIMPMIGARFYTQLDSAQLRSDVIENELTKEVENGRLFRLLAKLGTINERPEYNLDMQWSETGDRYMLKLFRDYLFHQVDQTGAPWIDMAHIVQCLNKLDSGSPERICLTSRDEQSVLVVSYAELKQNYERAFSELLSSSQSHSTFT